MGLCISLGLFMWKLWERKKGKGASYLHAWGNICSTSETQIIVCIMVTSELLMKGCQTWKLRNQCLQSWDTSTQGLSKQPGSLVHADCNQSWGWSRAGTSLVIFRVILRFGDGKQICLFVCSFVFHRRFSWLLNTQTLLWQHLGHARSRGICWKFSITHTAGGSSHPRKVQTKLIAPRAVSCQHRARERLHLLKGLVQALLLLPAKFCLPIAPAERGGWTVWDDCGRRGALLWCLVRQQLVLRADFQVAMSSSEISYAYKHNSGWESQSNYHISQVVGH